MKKNLMIILSLIVVVVAFYFLFFFQRSDNKNKQTKINLQSMAGLVLKSAAFKHNGFIPEKYTCDGLNVNPSLQIENIPSGTKSLVLIMDDPDATGGVTWDHWLVWNLNPDLKIIEENQVPTGAIQGTTSFGEIKYGGPCPPRGSKPHRYMFKLYALDSVLNLAAGASKAEIEKAMEGHILDKTVLIGLYSRK